MSNNVTCIIPTRNRADFLRRCLLFIRLEGSRYDIIVADSSNDAVHRENIAICETAGLNQLTLLKYDEQTGFFDKLASAIGRATTPFLFFLADDDFIFEKGVSNCIEQLQKDESLIAVAGTLYVYNQTRPNPAGALLPHQLTIYPQRNELGNDLTARVSAHIANYAATFYSVYRSKVALQAFTALAGITDNLRVGEIFSSAFVLSQGRRMVVPETMGVRVAHEDATHRQISNLEEESKKASLEPILRGCLNGLLALAWQQEQDLADPWPRWVEALRKYLLRVFPTDAEPNRLALRLLMQDAASPVIPSFVEPKAQIANLLKASPPRLPESMNDVGGNPVLLAIALCAVAKSGISRDRKLPEVCSDLTANLDAMPFLTVR